MQRQSAAARKQAHGALRSARVRASRATTTPLAALIALVAAIAVVMLLALSARALIHALPSARYRICAASAPFGAGSAHTSADAADGTLSRVYQTAPRTVALVFSTGRAGTQHMSRLFLSLRPPLPTAYVTHQEEGLGYSTRDYVARYYRSALGDLPSEAKFNESAREFVTATKLPFFDHLLDVHGATRLVYTGHLPLVFGLGSALLDALPRGTVRILRLRRDRIASALSLMALGPENEEPWSTSEPGVRNRRWFPGPSSAMVRLRVDKHVFDHGMNRFQRWLWYVDDVECRWQALVSARGRDFEWVEESLEALEAMDGGRGWARVAHFLGVRVRPASVGERDNSIQRKHRVKLDVSEATLRQWDVEYRTMVGACDLGGGAAYSWANPGSSD
jgi:hypothetical protein